MNYMLYTIAIVINIIASLVLLFAAYLIFRNKLRDARCKLAHEAALRKAAETNFKTAEANLNAALDYINQHNLLIPAAEMKLQDYAFDDIASRHRWN
jgi:CHASE1-domain containing sensor protein